MRPTIGRIVIYRLNVGDVQQISAARSVPVDPGISGQSFVHGMIGNPVTAGDECPAMVVRTFDEGKHLNLKVQLDGRDTLWVTSRGEGTEDGTWRWPERS